MQRMMDAPDQKTKLSISAEESTHPTPCPLWDWADCDKPCGNSMLVAGYELMHNADLGVWLYIVEAVPK